MPNSIITFALLICSHSTGIPSQGSDEPHLPGPINIYELLSNFLLSYSIS